MTIGTTHYSELKLYAHNAGRGERLGRVRHRDAVAHLPGHHRAAGRSQAFAIAARLGSRAESSTAHASGYPGGTPGRTDARRHQTAREEAQESARRTSHPQAGHRWEKELTERPPPSRRPERSRSSTRRARKAAREIDETRKQLRRLAPRMSADAVTREWIEEAGLALDELASAGQPLPSAPDRRCPSPRGDIKAGDTVWVPEPATARHPAGRRWQRCRGEHRPVSRARSHRGSGSDRARTRTRAGKHHLSRAQGAAPRPTIEIEIRGLRVEDALPEVDKYLDSAYLAGMPFVRIIHGKGTRRPPHRPSASNWTAIPWSSSIAAGSRARGTVG